MLNFVSNICAYGHNLLAYERNARGCKFAPGVNLHPGAILHPVANCAYEHGLRKYLCLLSWKVLILED